MTGKEAWMMISPILGKLVDSDAGFISKDMEPSGQTIYRRMVWQTSFTGIRRMP